jgi:hypothetical protein
MLGSGEMKPLTSLQETILFKSLMNLSRPWGYRKKDKTLFGYSALGKVARSR